MATFVYDGKSNLTAASTDTVVLTADPTLFTQASQNLNDAVLRFGANSLTITGGSVASLTNITLAGGTFAVGAATSNAGAAITSTTANSLVIGTDGASANFITGTTVADSKNALFGGNGISSPNDGADSFSIGGKGSFLVYGNGGADVITQNAAAFDSTSAVTVFGGAGGDNINLNTALNKGSLLILGGEGADSVSVFNTGNTTIFGGTGAGDSADGNDSIALLTGSGGTINVFANGGADTVSGTLGDSTAATSFANNTVANIYGGAGSDSINIGFGANAKGTVTVYGGEDGDYIRVVNTGTTTIYGGTGPGDSTDGADSIGLAGSGGTITVYGNAGADIIGGTGLTAGSATTFADSTNATIFGGKGNDSINLGFDTNAKGTLAVYGGEDTDTITVANGVGGSTTVFGGTGQGDSADGADTINIGGSGLVNVFGNGGNDTINLRAYVGGDVGTASANVVTVYAGTGNDSINVGGLVNGKSTIVLNGNEGADTFTFSGTAANTTAGTGFGASIADFVIGTDKLNVENGTAGGGTATVTTVPTGGFADLQSALNAATQGAVNTVTTVVFGGSAYVVVNDGTKGFDPNADLAIKLTGITDANAAANAVTVI